MVANSLSPTLTGMARTPAAALVALLFAIAGCSSKSPSAAPSANTVLTPSAAPATTSAPSPTPAATKSAAATSAAPTGPHIAIFRVKVQPRCTTSGPGGTFNGNGPTLEWAAVNVDQVTISIDGPGIFGTYESLGSHEFPFGCGPAGTTTKHTYTLRTVGGGTVQERTLTVEAKAL